MQNTCDFDGEIKPSGFIGYKLIKKQGVDIVRIYLNCKNESSFDAAVDVIFWNKSSAKKKALAKFSGLDELSTIKKFNRFVGCLEERAREEHVSRERIFESSKQLLYFLSVVKNSKNFEGRPEEP